jgi:N6-adenosine-specific RNA methylase IME4
MGKKYNIIYADPPWSYERQVGKGIASEIYPTMTIAEMVDIPVKDIAADNAVLFLWVTFPKLTECFPVIQGWGFNYRTCAFNWIKQNPKSDSFFVGLGSWTRSCSEICLLATKGHPRRVSKSVRQLCIAHRMQHSKKPDEIRDRIVELCGDLPRIELFAREKSDGWDCLGNEIDGRDIRDAIQSLIV